MKQEALQRWSHTRSLGMLRYVLVSGVLSWGVPMFVIMTFFVNRRDLTPSMIGISALVWLVGGALFGTVMWHVAERQYRKASSGGGT